MLTAVPLIEADPAVMYPHKTAVPVKLLMVHEPETGNGNGEVPFPDYPG